MRRLRRHRDDDWFSSLFHCVESSCFIVDSLSQAKGRIFTIDVTKRRFTIHIDDRSLIASRNTWISFRGRDRQFALFYLSLLHEERARRCAFPDNTQISRNKSDLSLKTSNQSLKCLTISEKHENDRKKSCYLKRLCWTVCVVWITSARDAVAILCFEGPNKLTFAYVRIYFVRFYPFN